MVVEEEWFDDMNVNDGATFPTDLIKREKSRIDQNNNFPCDTKRCIRQIAINNGLNTCIVQILGDKRDGKFIFKGNFSK